MRRWVRTLASIAAVVAMAGSPAVLSACALLCLPSAASHSAAAASETAPCHDQAPAPADAPWSHHSPQPDRASVAIDAPSSHGIPGHTTPPARPGTIAQNDGCCPEATALPATSPSGTRTDAAALLALPPPAIAAALPPPPIVAPGWRSARSTPRLAHAGIPLVLRI